jgi:putative peptide zinc metalloprotease protein
LERLRGVDPAANDELPTARAALADAERRLDDRRQEAARLVLTSPAEGVILPAPRSDAVRDTDERLASWNGSLLEESNVGATVEPGTLMCLVGDPARVMAVLFVDDVDAKRLRRGQHVRMRVDQLPGRVIEGEIIDVAHHEMQSGGSAASSRADLTTLYAGINPPGRRSAIYQVRVQFETPDQQLVIGGRGQAKVAAERMTLGRKILRLIGQTFRLPM